MTLRKFYLIYNEYLDYNGLRKKDEELNLDTIFTISFTALLNDIEFYRAADYN